MAITALSKVFSSHIEERYKGKVRGIERMYRADTASGLTVRIEFRLPPEVDEMETFRRINKVIEVIAEGDDYGE